MTDNFNTTSDVPGTRVHIGIFGKRNAGKSTLFNTLLGQEKAIVSPTPGTTTDPVEKNMELAGVGTVTLIDTPGYDDTGELGSIRVEQSVKSAAKCDVALFLINGKEDGQDRRWIEYLEGRGASVLIFSREATRDEVLDKIATEVLRRRGNSDETILRGLVREGDTVVLVMPQDKAAPKGRLIMPQMQTIRELLDRGCVTLCVSPQTLSHALSGLASAPDLVITDSQAFASVREAMKAFGDGKSAGADALREDLDASDRMIISDVISGIPLTSFSILFSRYKGDIDVFTEGARAIDSLTENSKVLIAEACTHRPLSEDIGRVKLPALLRRKVGEGISITVVAGSSWPSDLSEYDLIIHCGACMFNRRHVLNRIADARDAGVPITNYGLAISKLTRKA